MLRAAALLGALASTWRTSYGAGVPSAWLSGNVPMSTTSAAARVGAATLASVSDSCDAPGPAVMTTETPASTTPKSFHLIAHARAAVNSHLDRRLMELEGGCPPSREDGNIV